MIHQMIGSLIIILGIIIVLRPLFKRKKKQAIVKNKPVVNVTLNWILN